MKRLMTLIKVFLLRHVYSSHLLHVLSHGKVRVGIVRYCGARVGNNVQLGPFVYWDNHLELLEIGNNVIVSPQACFLFHKRDLKEFSFGKQYLDVPHLYQPIKLCDNCSIGTRAIILPGVTIGEGACVGAGALVTKDVPAWTVVAGIPAKIIRSYRNEL